MIITINKKIGFLLALQLLGFCELFSQAMVINGNFTVANGTSISVFNNSLFIGPNANLQIDGVVNNVTEKTYVNPTSVIGGAGTWSFEQPSNYTIGGTALPWTMQTIDGGSVNLNIDVQINNANNVALNSITQDPAFGWTDNGNTNNLYVGKGLKFNVADGHLMLNAFYLVLDNNATINLADATKYVVTNGLGMLKKEALAASGTFVFPIGRAELDYTPITVTNNNSTVDDFTAQVKNYAESASDEADPLNGVYRTWNLYSTLGSAATIALQHNSVTNGPAYTTDPDAFVTQYLGVNWVPYVGSQGTWQLGTGATGTNSVGSIAGSVTNYRAYSSTATSSTDNSAYFSKSTNLLQPLPVHMLSFTAKPLTILNSKLEWSTSNEQNIERYDVFTSVDGEKWSYIGAVASKGNNEGVSNYSLIHKTAQLGVNFYKLKQVELNQSYVYSSIATVVFEEGTSNNSVVNVYPNPSSDELHISSNQFFTYKLFTIDGKEMSAGESNQRAETILPINEFAAGVYFLQIYNINNENTQSEKIIITK